MNPPCKYSIMTERDLKEVLTIERVVFKHPWSKDFFRLIISDINNYVVTLSLDNLIIGYGGYHLLKHKANFLSVNKNYTSFIHLINIAVKPYFQKKGFGTYLMNILLNNARMKNAEYCYLEVRPSNNRAITFYSKLGFNIIGIIENYYPQENENALVMGKELMKVFI